MHRPGVKCVQANVGPCGATNCPCTSGFPSENFRNRGPTRTSPPGGRPRSPTALSLTTNTNQNTEVAHKSALILCQANPPVVFYPYAPLFSPSAPTGREEWPVLPSRAETTHAEQALTKTSTPDTATPAAGGIGKRNSN